MVKIKSVNSEKWRRWNEDFIEERIDLRRNRRRTFYGDILIKDEMLEEIGENLQDHEAEVIDLGGLSVSPGFDAHSHNDFFAIKKEPEKYFEPFVRQGITSFIAGNCGLSSVGFRKTARTKRASAEVFSTTGM